ncbi:MAG: hypothetical protein ACOX55_02915 [Christensenellales bacterium]
MSRTRYVVSRLMKIACLHKKTMCLCLVGCVVGMMCVFLFFSVLRRIYVDDAFGWGPARTTTICFAQCMPAADVVALLEKQQGINGYILYMDVAAHPLSGEQLFLHGVRGAVAEVCTPATALAGTLEGNDADLFMLRSASHVPQAFLLAADDMVIQINDDNFACAGVQNGTWELSWSPMVPSPMAVSIQRAGSNRVFDESEWLNHGVIITAACAARHNYPVSALRITFWSPDARGAFLTLLGHFGDNVAQYHMPWGDGILLPTLEEMPMGMWFKILPVLIAVGTMMTLVLHWLGTFRFVLRIWRQQGASYGVCRNGLFQVGMGMALLACPLGWVLYRLVLLWGEQKGLMYPLPTSVTALIVVLYVLVCGVCIGVHSIRSARVSLYHRGIIP